MSLNLYRYHSDPESLNGFDQVMNSVPHLAWEYIVGPSDGPVINGAFVPHNLDIESGEFDLEELQKREHAWAKSAEYSYRYAKYALKYQRFIKGEDAIATDALYSYQYAKNVLKGLRVEKIEDGIATEGWFSFLYAKYVIKKRFPKGEDAIADALYNYEYSYEYARDVLKGERVEKIEDAIATSAWYSYEYAKHVIKKRFPKGEPEIRGSEYQERYEQEFGIEL